jgi:hypothetical protein
MKMALQLGEQFLSQSDTSPLLIFFRFERLLWLIFKSDHRHNTTMSPPSSVNNDSPLHPQRAIHKLSLLSSTSPNSVHLPTTLSPSTDGITAIGSEDAQAYWLNAARGIDWIKPPTVAYGKIDSEVR